MGQATEDTIVVAPGASGLHFYHVVAEGETLESLSQEFDLPKHKLASVNSIEKLSPYSIIKVPINPERLIQNGNRQGNADNIPLYHKVSNGETLFRIGKLYNDVPVASIKDWNNLKSNSIRNGQYLIIGYLNTKSENSNPTTASNKPPAATSTGSSHSTPSPTMDSSSSKTETDNSSSFLKEVIYSERQRAKNEDLSFNSPDHSSVTSTTKKSTETEKLTQLEVEPPSTSSKESKLSSDTISKVLKQENPIVKQEEKTTDKEVENTSPTFSEDNSKESLTAFEGMLRKITEKKPDKTTNSQKATPKNSNNTTSIQQNTTSASQSREKEEMPPPVLQTAKNKEKDSESIETLSIEDSLASRSKKRKVKKSDSLSEKLVHKSAFAGLFQAQTQGNQLIENKRGAASWFKSNIKPGSTKYYALCDSLPRGTVVKVINPINQRFIYAKVLAPIPKSKENYNLIIKLSDAAKKDLKITEQRFWSKIAYPKLKD